MPVLEPPVFDVTQEKVAEAVQRIVTAVDPLEIIVFGSRARGDHRVDSDLDLAVILDVPEDTILRKVFPYDILQGMRLDVDLVVLAKAQFDRFRPWINTVHNYIDTEGVRLYERGKRRADQDVFRSLC